MSQAILARKEVGMDLLTTENLHLYYGKKEALKGISLTFQPKEISALIGPSGCGKSTFLRCLNRMNDDLNDVTITGSVTFQQQNIYSPQTDVVALRKKVGMVFQQPNPFPFSVFDNVAFGLRLANHQDKAFIAQRVEESLKKAAIWDEVKDLLHKNALSFSGGQQQRICIARVLAVEPEIILLDEPTSALDPISTLQIEKTLQELKGQYTIIMVTHNLQQAARISDETAFFLNGELVESQPTEKIFVTPQHQATNDYLNGRFG